jgi:hypothetical protein
MADPRIDTANDILCGNRILISNYIEDPEINDKTGQVIELQGDNAMIILDESNLKLLIPLICLENLPRRFAGKLMKYSTKGIIRNWKLRYFEVWSNSLTYRPIDSPTYKGEVKITPQTEIIHQLSEEVEAPLPFSFGILNGMKVFRLCCEDEDVVEEMKRAIQDAINDSVMYITG